MPRSSCPRGSWPPFLHLPALAILVGVAAWGGIALTRAAGHIASISPAGGALLGVLLYAPRRLWPAYLLVGTGAKLAAHLAMGDGLTSELPLVLVDTIEVAGAGWLLRRLLGRSPDLKEPRSFVGFLAVATCLAPAAAAVLAAGTLSLLHARPFSAVLPVRFAANALGMGIVAPLVLCVLRGDVAALFSRRAWLRSACLVGFTATAAGVFLQTRYPLLFLIPPVAMTVVAQLGVEGVTVCVPILTGIALVSTIAGRGPFSLNPAVSSSERVILVQLFVFASFLLARWMAHLVADRLRIAAALQAERDHLAVSEQRLCKSEAAFRLLAEHASDMVSRVGPDGTRLYVSPASRRLLGVPPETLVEGSVTHLIHPADTAVVAEWQARLLAGTVEDGTMVFRALNPERGEVWVEAGLRALRDPVTGAPDGYVSVLRDISERQAHADELGAANAELERLALHLARARDQAERASQAKSRFLTGMTHELRTPLNGVIGYAELLRLEGGLSAKQAGRVDAMLGAGTHLLQMINRVLDLSEVEAERTSLQTSDADLHQIAGACLDLVRPAAEAKRLALRMDVAPDVPRHVRTDATRLRQMLLNLLGNAVKFTACGVVALRMRVVGGTVLRFEVADTGPGISAEHRSRLFQYFERLGVESAAVEGAGVGLALSARLAALLGGRMAHEDNPGGGSVFWLELPLAADAGAAAAPHPTTASSTGMPDTRPAATPAHPIRVLVVDDMAMNRDIAGSFLLAAGHEVVCADGGAEAVEAAAASDFDAVLMDVRMPGVDGLEATRRIRALPGPRGRVPIVGLTAQAFAGQVETCRAAGMDDHLAKPFQPDALLAVVARAVAAGQVRDEPRSAPVPVVPAAGSGVAILDAAVFERTAAFLTPETVAAYMQTIGACGEALLRGLRAPDALAGGAAGLASEAHALAGSAGFFGFERLAAVARHFESAVQTGSSDAQALAQDLSATLELSLRQMPGRMGGAVAAASTRGESGVAGVLAAASA